MLAQVCNGRRGFYETNEGGDLEQINDGANIAFNASFWLFSRFVIFSGRRDDGSSCFLFYVTVGAMVMFLTIILQ